MDRTKHRGRSDKAAARELYLYIDSDADLYRQQTLPIIQNLARKWKKGIYSKVMARKLWGYLAETGAKKYTRDFGDRHGYGVFNPATRKLTAYILESHNRQTVAEEASGMKAGRRRGGR